MKRRNISKQPGIGDFKNKCSEKVKRYDARIIRTVYETIHENVYWNGVISITTQKDIIREIEIKLNKQHLSILHLAPIVEEMLTYFSKFLIVIDPEMRKQI